MQSWDFLLFGLQHFKIQVLKIEGKHIELFLNYSIEYESENLFKLMHKGRVIAPFTDVEELCNFLIEDVKQQVGDVK